jgi:hypothetical protein
VPAFACVAIIGPLRYLVPPVLVTILPRVIDDLAGAAIGIAVFTAGAYFRGHF